VTLTLDRSVELLDRALDYTSDRLAGVHEELLGRPTPCVGWTLSDLLAHMGDALDAFTEAAGGAVDVHAPSTAAAQVASLRTKACSLLMVWSRPAPGDVVIRTARSRVDLGTPLLVSTAALEITTHGWDVGQATGSRAPIPAELARRLLPVARELVAPTDRGTRFAPARRPGTGAADDVKLLAFLGRT
jgi:uncharacterized protein (TIGR03086 family)